MQLNGDLLVSLFDVLGFVQGTLLGLILLFSGKKSTAFSFLGIFLLAYSIELFIAVVEDNGPEEWLPGLIFIPVRFYWLFMPALYLYTKAITKRLNTPRDYIHFLPGVLEFTAFFVLFLFPANMKAEWLESGVVETIDIIHVLLSMIIILTYAFLIIRFIRNHRRNLVHFHSNLQNKNLTWVIWIVAYVILTIVNPLTLSSSDIVHQIASILNVVFIFWVALSGFRQLYIPIEDYPIPKKPVKEKTNTNHMTTDFAVVQSYMRQDKPYTNPQLTLKQLAQQLDMPQRQLSELINAVAGQNFNQYINQYRVEEAKKMLKDAAFDHLSVLGIAYEAGFSSKSSFNTTFKNITGLTPTMYKNEANLA